MEGGVLTMKPNLQDAAEVEAHAQAVFARLSRRHRLPEAHRARGQRAAGRERRADRSTQQPWESGVDKALPKGDRE